MVPRVLAGRFVVFHLLFGSGSLLRPPAVRRGLRSINPLLCMPDRVWFPQRGHLKQHLAARELSKQPWGNHLINRVKLNFRKSGYFTFSEWETLIWYFYSVLLEKNMDTISYSQVNRESYLNTLGFRSITLHTLELLLGAR